MIQSVTPLPITPEMIKAPKDVAEKADESATSSEQTGVSADAKSRPAHPDEVGQMVNVEA